MLFEIDLAVWNSPKVSLTAIFSTVDERFWSLTTSCLKLIRGWRNCLRKVRIIKMLALFTSAKTYFIKVRKPKHQPEQTLHNSIQESSRCSTNSSFRTTYISKHRQIFPRSVCRCHVTSIWLLARRPETYNTRWIATAHRHISAGNDQCIRLWIDPLMREVVKQKMTIEENTSRRTAKSSHNALLSAVFMVLMWVVLLVLIPLRRGGSGSVPVDYIVNATNMLNSSWNSYK